MSSASDVRNNVSEWEAERGLVKTTNSVCSQRPDKEQRYHLKDSAALCIEPDPRDTQRERDRERHTKRGSTPPFPNGELRSHVPELTAQSHSRGRRIPGSRGSCSLQVPISQARRAEHKHHVPLSVRIRNNEMSQARIILDNRDSPR